MQTTKIKKKIQLEKIVTKKRNLILAGIGNGREIVLPQLTTEALLKYFNVG